MGKPQGSLEVRPLCPVGIRTKVAIATFISTTGPPNIVVVSQGNTPETKSGAQSHPRERYRQIRARHRPQREQRPLSRHGEISHLEMVKSRLVMGCGAVRRPPRRLMACEIDLDSAELCYKRRQEGLMSDAGTWQESAIEGTTIRRAEDGEVLAVIGRGRMESELRDRVVCLSRLSLSQSLLRLSRSGIRSGLTARPRWSRRGWKSSTVLCVQCCACKLHFLLAGSTRAQRVIRLRIPPAIMPPSFSLLSDNLRERFGTSRIPNFVFSNSRHHPPSPDSPRTLVSQKCIYTARTEGTRGPRLRKKEDQVTVVIDDGDASCPRRPP